MKMIDLTGRKFGRLTVKSKSTSKRFPCGRVHIYWECECDCGTMKHIDGDGLKSGTAQSCGCLQSEKQSRRMLKHGLSKHRVMNIWSAMIQRTTNPNNNEFHNYGGRGISVCPSWMTFTSFVEDMGLPPTDLHSIERKDNSAGYSKDNCKWATPIEQGGNKRNNINLTIDGRTQCMSAWAREENILMGTVWSRVRRGWDHKKAVFQKPRAISR